MCIINNWFVLTIWLYLDQKINTLLKNVLYLREKILKTL